MKLITLKFGDKAVLSETEHLSDEAIRSFLDWPL